MKVQRVSAHCYAVLNEANRVCESNSGFINLGGRVGSYAQFFTAIDTMIELDPAVVVPGHGPVVGIEALRAEREYFQHVHDQSRTSFDAGLTAKEAAERIPLGRFGDWKAPTRLSLNVERAYREFRSEAPDAPWDKPAIVDSMHDLAGTRGLPIEY